MMPPASKRIRVGVLVGLVTAMLLSLVALPGFVFGPAKVRYGVTYFEAISAYFAGGVALGVLGGALAPLGRHWLGAMLLGIVMIFPFLVFLVSIIDPTFHLTQEDMIPLVAWAAIVGGSGGIAVWYNAKRYL
jgi:hypothetical protein